MIAAVAPKGIEIGPREWPKLSLADEIFRWTYDNLLQPDGPDAGKPWQFTPEQAMFLYNWYAVDKNGRFVYRYGMLRRMKGWGKDPMGAALACVEFVGPCRFSHMEGGKPVAKQHPAAWVQTAAVSRDQTRNTMTLFPSMISPWLQEQFQIDIGKEIIYAEKGKRRIEAVTSSPRALEGGRATFILKNETHHWRGPNEGHEMAAVIARNAGKSRDGSSRILAISNAHAPGEDSDAEHDYEAWKKVSQLERPADMLYDSLEAPETDLADDQELRAGLLAARGQSEWLDVDRLMAEIRDPRTTPAMARRFYLNQIVAEEDKPFDAAKFGELKREHPVPPNAQITLGFDGSLTRDHTALIGTEIETNHQWVVGYWEPRENPNGDITIDFDEVDQTVDYAFKRWRVWRMYADPYRWGSYLAKWAGLYGADHISSRSTTSYRQMANDCAKYRIAIERAELTHDGDPRLVGAVSNSHKHMHAFRDDNDELMWTIQKERQDSPLKIDAAVAAVLSLAARTDAIAAGVRPRGASINPDYDRREAGGPEMAGVRGKQF
jgi:phage terminase large subunit-like protein